MAVKNFVFRESWVVSKVAGMKTTMGHMQNRKQFFSEITKPDQKLSKTFYFIKILYVLAELLMFFYFM